jgi:hypothetical protein
VFGNKLNFQHLGTSLPGMPLAPQSPVRTAPGRYAFALAALALSLPAGAEAASFVKSVEYVEITMGAGATNASANLTKGQVLANAVPFASMRTSGTDDEFDQVFTDVFFQSGPARVTAQRFTSGGTLDIGVYVVEFDPAYVNVRQGTFSLFAGVATTTAAIPAVDLTKAALVSYYNHGAVTNSWNDYAIAGWFSLPTQITWQRNTSAGAVTGHYYVFEARNNEFSVLPVSFPVAANQVNGTATIAAVDLDKSFVIASFQTAYASDDNEDGQIGVFLANSTTVQAQRSFQNSSSNAIPDVRAFVVQFPQGVRVQRGTLAYGDTDTLRTATIESANLSSALVWNGSSIGPGTIQNEGTSSTDGDTAFQRLKLANATTVQGDRDGVCGGTDCGGIGHFEVIDFNPVGQMMVKSGQYGGSSVARSIYVGFQPDVVFIKRDDTVYGVARTSSMLGDATKSLDNGGVALFANGISSLDPTGFSLGTHLQVNLAGQSYYWVAFKAAPGELKVGSYTGNNMDNRSIPGVGFQPEYVITLPAAGGAAGVPVSRSSTMLGDTSYEFDSTEFGPPANAIQAFEADGFQIGNASFVNANTATFHYIAWNAVPGRMAVGSYTGDGLDDRNIDVVGFQPEWVLVKRSGDPRPWVHKPASTGLLTDYSLYLADFTGNSADIQQLRPQGFQVGFGPEALPDRTNENGVLNHWIAFGPHSPQVNYRSIGTNGAAYSAGTITATVGSPVVTGVGTGWKTANRGRGDSMSFGGFTGTILSVDSETQLTLTTASTVGGSPAYTISRKFTTLAAWEGCVDGGACGPDPATPSTSLVNDDRSEVGIAYDDGPLARVSISGSITDATHTITLTADPGNRHLGVPGGGTIVDGTTTSLAVVLVDEDFVNVEWLEIQGGLDEGIEFQNLTLGNNQCVARNLLIHNTTLEGILIDDADANVDAYNNIVYANGAAGIRIGTTLTAGTVRILNNTVYGNTGAGITASGSNPTATLRNNISHSNGGAEFSVSGENPASSNNLSSDATATSVNPAGDNALWNNVLIGSMNFVNAPAGNLHIQSGSRAENNGTDLGSTFSFDVDGGARVNPWDMGADDIAATTEVELISFEARPFDGAVELSWETGSELKNLGFHVYRGEFAAGPWEQLTAKLVPGLGSSPQGARYVYRDSPLSNGTTYYYLLEDVEATGRLERHGPVEATPNPQASPADETLPTAAVTYGDPGATDLRILSRGPSEIRVVLTTGGFYALPQEDGTVEIEIPGFAPAKEIPALPVKLHWLEAPAGRKVEILSVRARDVEAMGLVPSAAAPELQASRDGTQRLRRSRTAALTSKGLLPEVPARIADVAFQGDVKKALLELSPLRWDTAAGQLLFARTLEVTLSFRKRDPSESAGARRGRGPATRGVFARLATVEPGLYRVRYEDLFRDTRGTGVDANLLRLSRLGRSVAFRLEPPTGRFAPGSALYFMSEGADANPYGNEAVYELESGRAGERMRTENAAPLGERVDRYWATVAREEDRYYQAALLEAPDLWLWDLFLAPSRKTFSFFVSSLAPSSTAKLEVFLQGASDFLESPDHHVRFFLNGTLVGDDEWNGKEPRRIELELPAGILRDGENALEIESLQDTGALYSMFFLDRFAVTYSRLGVASDGQIRGRWDHPGTAEVSLLGARASVLDVTESVPVWLTGARHDGAVLRFRVETARSYLVLDPSAVKRPEVRRAATPSWRKNPPRAEYLAIGPRDLLEAARPLLDHRRNLGLAVTSIPIEEVFDGLGYGETRPEAVRELLADAYQRWPSPLRYVLLLGDASYDFKDHLGTGAPNRVPALPLKTSFLWTASDPAFAAVNGDDLLPDVAIGRLPAADASELRAMVQKILAFEAEGRGLHAPLVLVTDNGDLAGDFDADALELLGSVQGAPSVRHISLGALGVDRTRDEIVDAFDRGASVVSYLGHGGIHIWASENVFSNDSIALLSPQAQQPLVNALDCLNGYFHFPFFDSLAEELLKAEGKGAVAVFAPSGLSLNGPAHQLHKALLRELFEGGQRRLGDAILAAQARYLETGSLPELLAIYHLFGDPALRIE